MSASSLTAAVDKGCIALPLLENSEFAYLFDESYAPSKVEIARQQIQGAMRAFACGHSPIVVHSLLGPASQILRDLNRGIDGSMAEALTQMAKEAGYSATKLWAEFNNSSFNFLKHATQSEEIPAHRKMRDDMMGAICFCAFEYRVHNRRGLSVHMQTFLDVWLAQSWVPSNLRALSCRARFAFLDFQMCALQLWMQFLLRLQRRVGNVSPTSSPPR